ncbi:riboflavin synthase [Thalassobacillus devorans]|uniref:Riboflavin synthase n=1 Tax=Thalassobacillus devorans TaxID=279813 RepID=A0ABQ1PUB3_9BACI|nr:riboflavin synthase [Thalassobacillus devorans]NIK29539.1 riboflavin synthase [Thalassobacillus devorans]GGD03906.1 riboflavin synthase [Thalassobacillus devorans]
MFTGIVEEIGEIQAITSKTEAMELTITANTIVRDAKLGDSISINGVCLTITDIKNNNLSFDVMPETYHATNLNELKKGSKVNLERAMAADGRFGGHLVSGHIDGKGKIVSKNNHSNAVYYDISLSDDLLGYFVYKGSVAVDGTSLTVFGVSEDTITISLIPHTMEHTVLGAKGVGDSVNIECDMISKYVAHFLSGQQSQKSQSSNLTKAFLDEHGFGGN